MTQEEQLADIVGKSVAVMLAPYARKIEKLQRRVAELETKPVLKFTGVWSAERAYVIGECATFSGSLWHARHRVEGRPAGLERRVDTRHETRKGRKGRGTMSEKKPHPIWAARPGATREENIAEAMAALDRQVASLRRSETDLIHQSRSKSCSGNHVPVRIIFSVTRTDPGGRPRGLPFGRRSRGGVGTRSPS